MPASSPEQANAEAFARLTKSEPVLEDVVPAGEALPGMTENTILASGPTLAFEEYELREA